MATLGDRLRVLRTDRRESLFQVAEAVGSSKAHIWDLERNRSKNPSLDLLRRMAAHFDTTVSYLIEEGVGDVSQAQRFFDRNMDKLSMLGRDDLHLVERIISRLSASQPVIVDAN